ncbi:MAG: cytochrome c [Myxococcales bacterium]|nr:cytochrome c [Myxococcales bacterium]
MQAPYSPDAFTAKAIEAAKAAGSNGVNPKSGDAVAITAGKALWVRCAACHGDTGLADTPTARLLEPRPANFHDRERWDFTSAGVKFWILANGIPGTGMTPPGLTADETWQVLAYIENDFVGK